MILKKSLKGWLTKNCNISADADDHTFAAGMGKAMTEGRLTLDMINEFNDKDSKPAKKSLGETILERLDALEKGTSTSNKGGKCGDSATMGKKKKKKATDEDDVDDVNLDGDDGDGVDDDDEDDDTVEDDGEAKGKGYAAIVKGVTAAVMKNLNIDGKSGLRNGGSSKSKSADDTDDDSPNPFKMFGGGTGDGQNRTPDMIRVKSAVEVYNGDRETATYAADCKHLHLRGMPAISGENGHQLNIPSQRDKAIAGAWFKFMVSSTLKRKNELIPSCYKMTEHDNQLVAHAMHELPFIGNITPSSDGTDAGYKLTGGRKMVEVERKALLDDSVSGGLEAAPIVFDDQMILTPILYGEIYPLINVVNITRGRRVEGFSMGNPTITSGTAEGTAISIFDTSSFIAAFDTTIFNAVGAIELGKDFEDDSPVNIGEQVMRSYGEQLLAWLDDQVANGDGVTEPQGVFVASGTVAVLSDNNTSGPPTLSDYEGLLFGVTKKYRGPQDRSRCIYISNETTYRRSRGMKVDPQSSSTDERRLLGLDHETYSTLGHPHKINDNIANSKIAFFNARRYRMYRRLGIQLDIEEGGRELKLKNKRLIIMRCRFGGQLEDGNAAAVMTTAKS